MGPLRDLPESPCAGAARVKPPRWPSLLRRPTLGAVGHTMSLLSLSPPTFAQSEGRRQSEDRRPEGHGAPAGKTSRPILRSASRSLTCCRAPVVEAETHVALSVASAVASSTALCTPTLRRTTLSTTRRAVQVANSGTHSPREALQRWHCRQPAACCSLLVGGTAALV